MNPYVSITFRTITIWIMAALVNGILCGIYLGIIEYENGPFGLWIFLVFLCSLFFAAPGFFIFWVVMLRMITRKKFGRSLFRSALSSGIITACATAFLSKEVFKQAGELTISLFILLSTITSIMMHFKQLKKIGSNKRGEDILTNLYNQNKSLR